MGIEKFENLIKDNKEYFEKEPSMDHMEKFFFKLQEQEEEKKTIFINNDQRAWWIGIAASLSLLISIGWFITQQPTESQKRQEMGLSLELTEIKSYYTQESTKKLNEIIQCADQSEGTQRLIASTENQLEKLAFNVEKLEDKLKDASGNKKIELAYIQNLKAKSDLVNNMHNQICKQSINILTQ